MQGLEHVDFVALLDQVAGHGQAGGTGAHHRHLLAGGFGLGGQDVLAVLALVIGGEGLQVADGHRGVFFADDAHAFALDFLGADPAAHRGQGVFLPEFADGAFKIAFLDAFDEGRNIDFHRAALAAAGVFALDAALRLLHGQFFGIAEGHFLEIARPDLGLLLRHLLPGDLFFLGGFDFFRHYRSPSELMAWTRISGVPQEHVVGAPLNSS